MNRPIVGAILLALTAHVSAATWTSPTTITAYFMYDDSHAYVKTPGHLNPDGCASSAYLALDVAQANFESLYATVIAAHMAGSTVSLLYNGCVGNYPRVAAIAVPNIW